MTYTTPIYGMTAPDDGDPIWTTALLLQQSVDTIETALQSKGLAAVGASDLLAVSGRVSTLEAVAGNRPVAPIAPAALAWSAGWANWDANNFEIPRVSRATSGLVTVAGTARNTVSVGAGVVSQVCTLPTGCRPRKAATVTVWANAVTAARVDVAATGVCQLFGPTGGAPTDQFWNFSFSFHASDATLSTTA